MTAFQTPHKPGSSQRAWRAGALSGARGRALRLLPRFVKPWLDRASHVVRGAVSPILHHCSPRAAGESVLVAAPLYMCEDCAGWCETPRETPTRYRIYSWSHRRRKENRLSEILPSPLGEGRHRLAGHRWWERNERWVYERPRIGDGSVFEHMHRLDDGEGGCFLCVCHLFSVTKRTFSDRHLLFRDLNVLGPIPEWSICQTLPVRLILPCRTTGTVFGLRNDTYE